MKPLPALAGAAAAAVALVAAGSSATSATAPGEHVQPTTIAVLADTPYGDELAENFDLLIREINTTPGIRTVVHLGDTKSGGTTCDDEYQDSIRAKFRKFRDPLLYTPGDNEWTDCHRDSNGDFNPIKRLAKIRSSYFDQPGQSLSAGPKQVAYQSAQFPENQMWFQSGVQIGLVHVVGSNNGLREWELGPSATDRRGPRTQEVGARTTAAVKWIDAIFDRAERLDAAGVLVMWHADAFGVFEFSGGDDMSGFTPIVQRLAERTEQFDKPVLLINGDSHDFYEWTPLSDADTHPNAEFYTWRGVDLATVDSAFYHGVGGDIDNLTQVVVEIWDRFAPEPDESVIDANDFGWLELRIDPSTPEVFSYEQRYLTVDG
ncbi:MAG: hypothetical protein AAFP84_17045 [Actinomycetota bacterium]